MTKTHILDLMNLYKRHRSTFGEIFFVVTGTKSEMTADTCQYENVLCIQYEDLAFSNPQDMETVVFNLTNKIHARFEVCQLFASLIYSTRCTLHSSRVAYFSISQSTSSGKPFSVMIKSFLLANV